MRSLTVLNSSRNRSPAFSPLGLRLQLCGTKLTFTIWTLAALFAPSVNSDSSAAMVMVEVS